MANADSTDQELDFEAPDYRLDDAIQAGSRSASTTVGTDPVEGGIQEIPAVIQGQAPREVIDVSTAPATGTTVAETGPTSVTDLGLIPVTEVKPEEVGSLSLRYTDGTPVLVVTGGAVIPATVAIVDGSGNTVGAYTVAPAPAAEAGPQIHARLTRSVIQDVDFASEASQLTSGR
ncbi:hypothetical protein [Streptomyces virginiae]|uniref:hypothetical protein n=1 Tax=Streptomyces virginiae TaxID=1961 RepID=UPI00368AE6DF